MPTSKLATGARAAASRGEMARSSATNAGAIHASGDWRERARCAEADLEAFYPDKGESSLAAKRHRAVRRCPNSRLGHRVTAADIHDAAEARKAVA